MEIHTLQLTGLTVDGGTRKLSTSFHKFRNVFLTPSPGPLRLVKAPAPGHPLPLGERAKVYR
jgi:hypothetical protein